MSRRQSSNVSVCLSSSSSVSSRSSSFRSLSAPSDEYNLSPPRSPPRHHHNQLFSSVSTKAHVPFSWEHLPGIPKNNTISTPPPPVVAAKPTGHRRDPKSHSPSKSGGSSSSLSFSSLPLPPSSKSNHEQKDGKKQSSSGSGSVITLTSSGGEADVIMSRSGMSWQDPFFAALMECSKDANETSADHEGNHIPKGRGGRSVGRSISDRFPIVNLITCLDQLSCKRSCGVLSEYVVVQKGHVRHG